MEDFLARWRRLAGVPVTRLSIDENFPAAIEQVVAQVRPEKSRASRDYRAQRDGLSKQMFPDDCVST